MEQRGNRFEPLVLALVAVASLPAMTIAGPEDRTCYSIAAAVGLRW